MYIAATALHAEAVMTSCTTILESVTAIIAVIVMVLMRTMMNPTAAFTIAMQVVRTKWTLTVSRIAGRVRILQMTTVV